MARALVLALACAMATSATSYGDYAGARMPHYRMDYDSRDAAPRDDYPERSPDAPVHLDYKYEEDPEGKLDRAPETAVDENDAWQKTKKRRNKPIDIEHDYSQDVDKFSSTDDREEKVKFSRVQLRNRYSSKRRKVDIEDETYTERERRRYEDVRNPVRENLVHPSDDRIFKSRNIERKTKNIGFGRDGRRSARRKARDKADPRIDDVDDGILMAEKEFDSDDSAEDEVAQLTGQRRMMQPERARVTAPLPDVTAQQLAFKQSGKSYADYDEYYDMKRVLNIKNKLPAILQRTRARYPTIRPTLQIQDWYRRANIQDAEEKHESDTPGTPSRAPTTKSTTKVTTKATKSRRTTTRRTTPKPTTKPTSQTNKPSNSSELSLAEKSRLSILKKAQRKESIKSDKSTTKPPVLMQVTQRMQTVVMVEPLESGVQRLRAREISDESPGRVAKAKRLMRHKLLANAKSIHDLTDNWDDMVCDYIDVSLLNKAPTPRPLLSCGLLSVVIISAVVL